MNSFGVCICINLKNKGEREREKRKEKSLQHAIPHYFSRRPNIYPTSLEQGKIMAAFAQLLLYLNVALPQHLEQKVIARLDAAVPFVLPGTQVQVVYVPCSGHDQDPAFDPFRSHRLLELHRHAAWHQLVLLAVDDERRSRIFPFEKLRQRVHGRDSIRPGAALPVVARHAVEQNVEGVPFLEEAQNQLGARVPGSNPAETAPVAGATSIACELNGGLAQDERQCL